MKTLSRFVTKFTSLIVAVLSCFDRVIFKGHLALAAPCELEYFVDRVLKVRRTDFMKTMAPQYSDRLVEHAQNWAQKAGRTYVYRTGQFRKDEWAQNLIRDQGISEGLVGILCTLETCPSFALVPGPERPQFVSRPRQQRVLYYYFLDPQFGLIHVRLQTWLPFTVQVYVNGHEWLAQQMVQKKLGFVQQHNAFTQLDDPIQAQRLADRFAQLNWPKILDRWARQVNPLLARTAPRLPRALGRRSGRVRHRLAVQKSRGLGRLVPLAPGLRGADLYPQGHPRLSRPQVGSPLRWRSPHPLRRRPLVRHPDQAPHEEQLAEDVRQVRPDPPGGNGHQQPARSSGSIARGSIATALPRWATIPMTKSVASLVDYQEQALACNRRYLDALAVVDDPTPAYPELRQLTEPKVVEGRSYAGFNPARREDVRLFRAVLDGDHIARGFRNGDIRRPLFGNPQK